MKTCTITVVAAALAAAVAVPSAAQTFGIDENPRFPLTGPPGFGYGAENPFGLPAGMFPPGFAPSPTLAAMPCRDSDMLTAGPTYHIGSPNGAYIDAVSRGTWDRGMEVRIVFTVDRLSFGLPGTAVVQQAMRNQQPSDAFRTVRRYKSPSLFVAWPGAIPYGGVLPAAVPGPNGNTLLHDDSTFGLLSGGVVVPPTAIAPPIAHGTHDNIDQYETFPLDADGDGTFDKWTYFTIYPDEAVVVGQSPANIWDVAPGATTAFDSMPWALAGQMGLDPHEDSIDALVVYDNGIPGGEAFGGPGAEPFIDYVLFSLAPGSVTLMQHQLTSADIFFSDFSGKFFTYAPGMTLGLIAEDGGVINAGDNVDGVEVTCVTDLDSDGDTDFQDLLTLLAAWGPNPAHPADFNGDGIVGFGDLLNLLAAWGPCS